MKTHAMIQPKATEMFAMRTYGWPTWGAHRMKQIFAGLFLGTLLGAIPNTWAGKPELPVDLGSAGDFAILAGTAISTVPSSAITGDIGTSPAVTHTAITGFGALPMDLSGTFSTSPQVSRNIYAFDYANPTPPKMVTATADMLTAYTTAAGRTIPDTINFGATAGSDRDLGGLTMYPGLHKWSTGVLISTDLMLDAEGDPDAVFIFQISGDLTIASYQKVLLSGGAQARNIFWQVAGGAGAIIDTYAHFEGVVMTAKAIVVRTGASFNGKLLAQSAVTLDQNNIMDSDLIPPPTVTLTIISEHGIGNPLAGLPPEGIVYTNIYGSTLSNTITSMETLGGTQYVNTGWSMIGNDPAVGTTNAMSMVHTNDAVLTWLWSTNYYLSLVSTHGSIASEVPGWKPAGQSFDLYPTPDFGYAFDHWEMNGVNEGVGVPLPVTMDKAKEVTAYFTPIFVDVSADVDWSVVWKFDPRRGYFLGTLKITNTHSRKVLLAPFWFEVESTDWHWLRSPDGLDANTGYHYVDISSSVASQLSGIGNNDQALDVGESVTVTGIQLMGRRTPTGLLMAVWADPPGTLAIAIDTDGDGVSDADEAIAGTSASDPESFFRIRLSADKRSVLWDTRPNRTYTILTSTNLAQGFTAMPNTIDGTGATALYSVQPQAMGDAPKGAVFYKVKVQISK